jgi:hypothetical protein
MYQILFANSAPEKGVEAGRNGIQKAVSLGMVNGHKIVMDCPTSFGVQ